MPELVFLWQLASFDILEKFAVRLHWYRYVIFQLVHLLDLDQHQIDIGIHHLSNLDYVITLSGIRVDFITIQKDVGCESICFVLCGIFHIEQREFLHPVNFGEITMALIMTEFMCQNHLFHIGLQALVHQDDPMVPAECVHSKKVWSVFQRKEHNVKFTSNFSGLLVPHCFTSSVACLYIAIESINGYTSIKLS